MEMNALTQKEEMDLHDEAMAAANFSVTRDEVFDVLFRCSSLSLISHTSAAHSQPIRPFHSFLLGPRPLQPYTIRGAAATDLETLLQLERESWAAPMQHGREHLLKRVQTQPPRCFVLEIQGQVRTAISFL